MKSRQQVQRLFKEVQEKRQPNRAAFNAWMGHSDGVTIDVDDRPGYVWIREGDVNGRLMQARNRTVLPRYNQPVKVGYSDDLPGTLDILTLNTMAMPPQSGSPSGWDGSAQLAKHAGQHDLNGGDTDWIQSMRILPFRPRPQTTADMTIYVEAGTYPFGAVIQQWDGGSSSDMTAQIPSTAGNALYRLVYIDGATNALAYVNTAEFAADPLISRAAIIAAAVPVGALPVAAVYLFNGQTTIDEEEIFDIRVLFSPSPGSVAGGGGSGVLWENILIVAKSGGDHATISAAITAASSGDLIMIAPGTYAENVTLKAGVYLTGLGKVTALPIIAPSSGVPITIPSGAGQYTVHRLTITPPAGEIGIDNNMGASGAAAFYACDVKEESGASVASVDGAGANVSSTIKIISSIVRGDINGKSILEFTQSDCLKSMLPSASAGAMKIEHSRIRDKLTHVTSQTVSLYNMPQIDGTVSGSGTIVGGYIDSAGTIIQIGKVNIGGIADSDDALHVIGDVDFEHVATGNDDHAFEMNVDAAGFGDVKGIDINYDTGAIATGEDEAVILVDINEIDAGGGEVYGLEVLSTDGGADAIWGMKAGAVVGPILQDSGTFENPTTGTNDTTSTDIPDMIDGSTGTNTTIFVADNDYILIGAAAAFTEIEFVIETPASNPGIKPTFGYSISGNHQFTEFSPIDGTNGFRNTGVVAWDAADLANHVKNDDTNTFDIKITRTHAVAGSVSLFYAKTAVTVVYSWDKNGKVSVFSVGIDTSTIPHGGVGYAKFAIDGPDGNALGPHIQYTTDADDFPLFQQLNWTHDNIAMLWDSHYDGDWKSSDAGSNFRLYKNSDTFTFHSSFGEAQGNTITWVDRLSIKAAEVSLNEGGGDFDFRVEGDTDTDLFFVDASTDRVGISTNAPAVLFQVAGAARVDGLLTLGSAGDVQLSRSAANTLQIGADDGEVARLQFDGLSVEYKRNTDNNAAIQYFYTKSRLGVSADDNDFIADIAFAAFNSVNARTTVAKIQARVLDVTDGTEDGQLTFQTMVAGVNASRLILQAGLQVGAAPTGGDKGAGTINVAADIYKNNTAFTNPDHVLEHWATGRIRKHKSDQSKGYTGLMLLDDLRAHIQENHRLPRISDEPTGIFERGDIVLEKLEELTLYILQQDERIKTLEAQA